MCAGQTEEMGESVEKMHRCLEQRQKRPSRLETARVKKKKRIKAGSVMVCGCTSSLAIGHSHFSDSSINVD